MSKIENENQKVAQDFIIFGNQKDEIDPITKSIRENILNRQLAILGDWFKDNAPDKNLDKESLRNYLNDRDNAQKLFSDKELKNKFEQAEIKGYRSVLDNPDIKAKMQDLTWDKQELETKSKIVRNSNGEEICTLKETAKNISFQVDNNGKSLEINSYRTIDFPISLKEGPLHLALAVKDKNGQNIAEDKAVYFTAHYDKQGKLTEVSTPQPVKFMGKGDDAVGYIEHQGEIYTLPTTQGKYKEMMQEVAKNNGLAMNLTQEIEIKEKPLAKDSIITPQEDKNSIIKQKQKESIQKSPESPSKDIQEEKVKLVKQKNIFEKIKDLFKKLSNKFLDNKKIDKAKIENDRIKNNIEANKGRTENPNTEIANKRINEQLQNKSNISSSNENVQIKIESQKTEQVQEQLLSNKIVNEKQSPENLVGTQKVAKPKLTRQVSEGIVYSYLTPPQNEKEIDKKNVVTDKNIASSARPRSYSDGDKTKISNKKSSEEIKLIEQAKEVGHGMQTASENKGMRSRADSAPPMLKTKKNDHGI